MDIFKEFFEKNDIFSGISYKRVAYIRMDCLETFFLEVRSNVKTTHEIKFSCGQVYRMETVRKTIDEVLNQEWGYMDADEFYLKNM